MTLLQTMSVFLKEAWPLHYIFSHSSGVGCKGRGPAEMYSEALKGPDIAFEYNVVIIKC